jgi:hypothetical protein
MAGDNATDGGQDTTSAARDASDAAISPDLEAKVQGTLDDTFGGLSDEDRQSAGEGDQGSQDRSGSDAADDDRTTTVREHKRRVRPKKKRSGWEEEDHGGEDSGRPDEHEPSGEAGGQDDGSGEQPGQQDAPPKDPPGDDAPPTPDDEAIPAHLIEAARRRGWSEDRIQRLVKADPDLARDTFEQLHEDANNLSREFASLGRQLAASQPGQGQQPALPPGAGQPSSAAQVPGQFPQPGQQGQPMPQAQPPQQGQQSQNGQFRFPDEVRSNLDDEFVNSVLHPLEQHLNQRDQQFQQLLARHEQYIQDRQNETLALQLDQFFDGQKGYKELYGQGDRSLLKPEQMQLRQRVALEAGAIRAGAAWQDRQLSVQEALEMAHNLVMSDHNRETARRDIQNQAKKRDGQITVRPTHRGSPESDADAKNPLAKATRTAQRKLRELNAAS